MGLREHNHGAMDCSVVMSAVSAMGDLIIALVIPTDTETLLPPASLERAHLGSGPKIRRVRIGYIAL